MPFIHARGNPASRIWIILERPFGSDVDKKFCMSGGMGFALQKMLEEAGIGMKDIYCCARRPDTDNPMAASSIDNHLQTYKPPLILLIGEAAGWFLPDLRPLPKQDSYKTQMNKYVGSLLQIPTCSSWDHWAMPIKDPQDLMADWTERNVTVYIDFGKIREELAYWCTKGTVQPLPVRTLRAHEMDTDEILTHLKNYRENYPIHADDIETVYPRKGSPYYQKHPGIPVTFGIAVSSTEGISFNIFRETPKATREVWRAFDALYSNGATVIGQNFLRFDSFFYNMMGFSLQREFVQDTLIRHHILWPELPHDLAFLTRQYTRQPYYKDEGKSWKLSQMTDLRRYNCLDVTVDFEVYEGQEQEFNARPHLKG